jgi:hypothetical protein
MGSATKAIPMSATGRRHIGRYPPESRLVVLTVSFVGPDPKRTSVLGCIASGQALISVKHIP